jgi:F0F1-type ATP synthase assembly protein I
LGEEKHVILDRNLKIGIISSVVATSLFIYLLDPLLRFVTFLLFKALGSVARGYTDRLFQQAALLTGPDPSLFLLSLVGGFIIGISTTALIFFLLPYRASDLLQERLRSFRFSKAFIRWTAIVVALLAIVTNVMVLYNTMFQLRITTSFTQHIVLLAPYISDQEAKLLRSRWTRMKSEQDFDALYRDLNKIAKTNGVVLPENKVYSFSSL